MREITHADKEALVDLKDHPGFRLYLQLLVEMEIEQAQRGMDPRNLERDKDTWVREGMGMARTLLETMLVNANIPPRGFASAVHLVYPSARMSEEMVGEMLRRMGDGSKSVKTRTEGGQGEEGDEDLDSAQPAPRAGSGAGEAGQGG